eukprot:Gregarina_sp_Poly_1__10204@NODE_705_length_6682_cov_51_577627_g532_i0_p2_GENE_NODE_705_length_6682_cov_51_577627_g532_i0NODE_705_length_6682_cov_51_577627_g532_i0_p2_ORF_typecomplete_len178_score4_35Carla_C4/PF01623_17/0_089DUF3208/PF11482_8/0_15_NODE_705_length_6682_cov_51_577627_g532_i0405938
MRARKLKIAEHKSCEDFAKACKDLSRIWYCWLSNSVESSAIQLLGHTAKKWRRIWRVLFPFLFHENGPNMTSNLFLQYQLLFQFDRSIAFEIYHQKILLIFIKSKTFLNMRRRAEMIVVCHICLCREIARSIITEMQHVLSIMSNSQSMLAVIGPLLRHGRSMHGKSKCWQYLRVQS